MLEKKAFLSISYGDTPLGTLRLTLRPDIVPRTVENFVHFLTAPRGYRNSTFHRIIPKFMAQAGDFINHDGTGSASIYGRSFADENFHLSHSQRGVLSMANSGKDTNGCQFFITFGPTAHLDGKHVVFGYVDWREDGKSADVLDKLERVRTDRRNGDRPLERVQIVDCGILDDNNNKATNATTATTEFPGNKLAGEAKKNKLLQAYGDKNPATAADNDEIDLDEEEEEEEEEEQDKKKLDKNINSNSAKDAEEIDLDDEHDEEQPIPGEINDQQPSEDDPQVQNNKVSSKKAALQKRLAALRTKINQSRTLNRREVHAEATRMGTEEATLKERKRQNKQDKNSKQSEYDTYVVGKLQSAGGDDSRASADSKAEQKRLASLSQPAFDSIRQMNARSEKKERSQNPVNDYYNPEGQYSNYERNLKSIRHRGTASATTDSYDPTMASYINNNDATSASERDGAKRLANEMKRRVEKKINKKRKIEFDETDVSYINDRNKRFNQKIGRNFDEHTAEIRQNLERGTAL